MKEPLGITGKIKYEHYDANGVLLFSKEQPNLVVNLGKTNFAKAIAGDAVVLPTHIAVGTSNTGPLVTDTALLAEIARVAITSTTAGSSSVAYIVTFGAGVGTGILREVGLFNAASGPDMFCRTLFVNEIPKGAGDSVILTWTLAIS